MEEQHLIDKLVMSLKKVPAARLKILELANEIPVANGTFAPFELSQRKVDIDLAIKQAEAYGERTNELVNTLTRMPQWDESED